MNSKEQSLSSSETALIQRAMSGSLEAFNELVLRHQSRAYHLAYALLGDAALAEDATQEGFVKAFQHIDHFRGNSFRAWLLKIVTNSAYDILRRAHRHPAQPLFAVDEDGEEMENSVWLADPTASVQEIVEQKETAKQLYQMLGELPDIYRSAITLIDIDEFDYTEAASILKVPLGTLKSRLARARFQMARKIKDHRDYERDLSSRQMSLAA